MLSFLIVSLQDYWRVAAFYPTPLGTVRKVLSKVDPWAKLYIEYGPGNGAFTKEILRKLPASGRLLVIETNKQFVEKLKSIKDTRLIIVQDDVKNISQILTDQNFGQADIIISGIPFSHMPKTNREEIIKKSIDALAKNGVFITYQHVPVILSVLKRYFFQISWYLDPRNIIPPYFVILAKKG